MQHRPSQHPPHICGSAAETALPFLTAYTQTLVWKDAEPQPRGGQGCRAPADTAQLWAPRTVFKGVTQRNGSHRHKRATQDATDSQRVCKHYRNQPRNKITTAKGSLLLFPRSTLLTLPTSRFHFAELLVGLASRSNSSEKKKSKFT